MLSTEEFSLPQTGMRTGGLFAFSGEESSHSTVVQGHYMQSILWAVVHLCKFIVLLAGLDDWPIISWRSMKRVLGIKETVLPFLTSLPSSMIKRFKWRLKENLMRDSMSQWLNPILYHRKILDTPPVLQSSISSPIDVLLISVSMCTIIRFNS
jgi:hypothetical protein